MLTNEEQSLHKINDTATPEETNMPILSLPPKMQRFIHLYMTGQYTLVKLSELLDVHPNTVGKWLKRQDVSAIIEEMQGATHNIVSSQIKALSGVATGRLGALMNSPIDGVALQAVNSVLDRAGHKPKQEIKVDKTVITYEEKLSSLINDVIDITNYEVMDDE